MIGWSMKDTFLLNPLGETHTSVKAFHELQEYISIKHAGKCLQVKCTEKLIWINLGRLTFWDGGT